MGFNSCGRNKCSILVGLTGKKKFIFGRISSLRFWLYFKTFIIIIIFFLCGRVKCFMLVELTGKK